MRHCLVPAEDELLVSGMVHQDLTGSMIADRAVKATGQIYCPIGADHLFTHRMPIGTVIGIPCFKMVVEDGDSDDSGTTTSEWEQDVRKILLVRITSEARMGPMKHRKIVPKPPAWDGDKKWCGHATTHLSCSHCRYKMGAITHTEADAATHSECEDLVILHRDVEVLGSTRDFGLRVFCTHRANCKTTKALIKKASIA
jgi:hypothetical protein